MRAGVTIGAARQAVDVACLGRAWGGASESGNMEMVT
jgi:hypothetical protein